MEQTFMTIHNLSRDANVLFASDSVADILGYHPSEIQGRSCFDYFHPEEIPFARSVHNRGVLLDKAAVLHYARILSKDGRWISCECCFTIVHDVLVACTSIYRHGEKSERRALEAPHIRRIFSSSPRDPRYHMLEHLSPKFRMQPTEREPRAALILNRFTRTLGIMFATNAVSSILGVSPEQLQEKSFYECIAENCLTNAIKCLESAKANDSIAYLRFWSRDPRREEDFEEDEEEEEDPNDDDDEDGSCSSNSDGTQSPRETMDVDLDDGPEPRVKVEPLDGLEVPSQTTSSSLARDWLARRASRDRRRQPIPPRELEAVVSCTSDGLVVVLRKARPQIPSIHPPSFTETGLFAAPWSHQYQRPYYHPPELFHSFQSPLLPQYMPFQDHVKTGGGPPTDQLMKSIRDVAVFAWAVVGINGNLASYSSGQPRGESQPQDGLPIWDPNAPKSSYHGPDAAFPQPSGGGASPADDLLSAKWKYYGGDSSSATGRGYTSTPNRMGAGDADAGFWPDLPAFMPSSAPQRAYSQVQQLQTQHPVAGSKHPERMGQDLEEDADSRYLRDVNNFGETRRH